jgi:hypothetical protein
LGNAVLEKIYIFPKQPNQKENVITKKKKREKKRGCNLSSSTENETPENPSVVAGHYISLIQNSYLP